MSDERKSTYGTTARNNTEPDSPYRPTSQKPAPDGGVAEDVPKDTRDVPFPIDYSTARIRRYSLGNGTSLVSDRKSTRLNSSHVAISYAVFCLKKKKEKKR